MKIKAYNFDVFDPEKGKIQLEEFFNAVNHGAVKPMIMWGCKRCVERSGVSNFAIYEVSVPGKGDLLFCTKHGFLTEDQVFRRKRPRTTFNRTIKFGEFSAKKIILETIVRTFGASN